VESGSTQLAGDCSKVRLSWALVSIDYLGMLAGHRGKAGNIFFPDELRTFLCLGMDHKKAISGNMLHWSSMPQG
jgi:hypothetical protein